MTRQKNNWVKPLADAINMVTTIAAAIGFSGLAGWWLDGKFATDPWLTILGILLGSGTGIKIMWDRLNANSFDKRIEKKNNEKNDANE